MRPRTDSVSQWNSNHYSYVDQPNSNLICCICQHPFVEPTTTRTCAHTFCRNCILHALDVSSCCPIDRSSLSAADLAPATPIIRDLVDELVVKCNNEAEGCPYQVQRQLLGAHMRDECQYGLVSCPNQQCGLPILRRDAECGLCVHSESGNAARVSNASPFTPSSSTKCAKCTQHISSSETLAAHVENCVSCPHLSHGCSWHGKPDELDNLHLVICPYQSLGGFFTIHDSRAARLEEENKVLRMRLEASEGLVRTLLGDVAAIKTVLGPFLSSPQLVAELSPSPPESHTIPSDAQDDPSSPANTTPDISSYFPPAMPPSPTSNEAILRSPTSPTNTYSQTFNTRSRQSTSGSSTVSLHAHISSLTSDLSAVRGEQEAHKRDTDAMNAQFGTELGALRASVGGLRMFVSELSSTVGGLLVERGGLPEEGGRINGLTGSSVPWVGRMYAPPAYGPGYPYMAPIFGPPISSPPSSVPVKL